ncbi:MAG: hypothetical protein U5L45_15680 [Saprospiraceae bacterium]|nr:hypothetical protein [Saprospiraceae bacterium]
MVHFSGKARKMNHLSSFCASEASAKVPFNAYFEFMYGFKNYYTLFTSYSFLLASLAKKGEKWFVFRAKPEKRTTFPSFASEASKSVS